MVIITEINVSYLIFILSYPAKMVSLATCDMSTLSLLASIPSMAKIGPKLTKLQSEVALFNNIFSKTVILP